MTEQIVGVQRLLPVIYVATQDFAFCTVAVKQCKWLLSICSRSAPVSFRSSCEPLQLFRFLPQILKQLWCIVLGNLRNSHCLPISLLKSPILQALIVQACQSFWNVNQ